MILKHGSGGATISIADAPLISFSGAWKPWSLEYYGDQLYWEAWFLSSGTLSLARSYTLDAWGIGGGGAKERADNTSGGKRGAAAAGQTNMVENLLLQAGTYVVTVGAGGDSADGDSAGGATRLGSILNCAGGTAAYAEDSEPKLRNRFYDETKNEAASGGEAGNGWLQIVNTLNTSLNSSANGFGVGLGAGATTESIFGARAAQGALVIRVPA